MLLLYVFIVLLIILTLLSTFGGSIRAKETFEEQEGLLNELPEGFISSNPLANTPFVDWTSTAVAGSKNALTNVSNVVSGGFGASKDALSSTPKSITGVAGVGLSFPPAGFVPHTRLPSRMGGAERYQDMLEENMPETYEEEEQQMYEGFYGGIPTNDAGMVAGMQQQPVMQQQQPGMQQMQGGVQSMGGYQPQQPIMQQQPVMQQQQPALSNPQYNPVQAIQRVGQQAINSLAIPTVAPVNNTAYNMVSAPAAFSAYNSMMTAAAPAPVFNTTSTFSMPPPITSTGGMNSPKIEMFVDPFDREDTHATL
jgi:DNA segregation ATPase FtsK/SpoIIIE-like protein